MVGGCDREKPDTRQDTIAQTEQTQGAPSLADRSQGPDSKRAHARGWPFLPLIEPFLPGSGPGGAGIPPGIGRGYHLDRSHYGQAASTAHFFAPDFRRVSLADFRGSPVLLNLWATWCGPCVREMPSLDRLAADKGERLTVIALALDRKGTADVERWMQKKDLRLRAYTDPENHILAAYNSPLPTTILFDAQGREIWRVVGALDWQGREASMLLDQGLDQGLDQAGL